jgi:signal transduction histidine kinase
MRDKNIVVDVLDDLEMMDCDQLEQVLMGLATNIADYSPTVTNFNKEDFCGHLRSAVVVLQNRSGN